MLTGRVGQEEEGRRTTRKGTPEASLESAGEGILVKALVFDAARGLTAIGFVTAPVGLTGAALAIISASVRDLAGIGKDDHCCGAGVELGGC